MANPKQTNTGLERVAGDILSSTARILLNLNKSLLNVLGLPDNSPIITAIKLFTVINCKTAQIADSFVALPDIRSKRDELEIGLGKLKTIPTQAAKTSSDLFSNQFVAPAGNAKEYLNTLENIRTDYRELIKNQQERIANVIDRLQNAKDKASLLKSQDVLNEFASQDTRRAKIAHELIGLKNNMTTNLQLLNKLYDQVYLSIPITERNKSTKPAAATQPTPPQNQSERPE
jgi:hypothetical protein